MNYKLLIFTVLLLSLTVYTKRAPGENPFKHVIVMVMENHSFDNMLGFMDAPIGTL